MLAAILMGLLLWLTAHFALSWMAGAHGLAQAATLGVLIAGGIAVYGLFLALLGVVSPADIAAAIQQNGPRDLRR